MDCILMVLLADNVLGSRQRTLWPVSCCIGAGAIVLAIAPLLRNLPIRLFVAALVLVGFGLIVWRLVLSTDERYSVSRAIRGHSFSN